MSSKTSTSTSKAERALLACSEALRVAIRAGHSVVKPKTLKVLLQLTVDFLRIDNGNYSLPFSQQFCKVLGTILEHEAHVELLDEDDWLATVIFCIEGINHQDAESSRISLSRQNSLMPGSSSMPRGRPSSAARPASDISQLAGINKRNAEELIECLRSLVSVSNAPDPTQSSCHHRRHSTLPAMSRSDHRALPPSCLLGSQHYVNLCLC